MLSGSLKGKCVYCRIKRTCNIEYLGKKGVWPKVLSWDDLGGKIAGCIDHLGGLASYILDIERAAISSYNLYCKTIEISLRLQLPRESGISYPTPSQRSTSQSFTNRHIKITPSTDVGFKNDRLTFVY